MRSLHRLADNRFMGESAAQETDCLQSVVSPARRSALDLLESHRADQLLTPIQQNLLSVIVDDLNVVDPPRQKPGKPVFSSERGAAALRLQSNSRALLEELCETPLVFAIRESDVESVDRLLKGGADPNESDIENVSPLCHACETQSHAIVKLLIDAGADVNHETRIGHRPLDIARWNYRGNGAHQSDNPIVALLLDSGADERELD